MDFALAPQNTISSNEEISQKSLSDQDKPGPDGPEAKQKAASTENTIEIIDDSQNEQQTKNKPKSGAEDAAKPSTKAAMK